MKQRLLVLLNSLGVFAAVASQVACTVFQNFVAPRSACANAGWGAKQIAATMA